VTAGTGRPWRNAIDIAAIKTAAWILWTRHSARSHVLVLQGGGALARTRLVFTRDGGYGCAPDWVAGVSIGAINGALIAGNPVERRLERLREFWNRVSSGLPLNPLAQLAPLRGG